MSSSLPLAGDGSSSSPAGSRGAVRRKPLVTRLRNARRRYLPLRRILGLLLVLFGFLLLRKALSFLHFSRDPFAALPRLPAIDTPASLGSRRTPLAPSRILLLVPSSLPSLPAILSALSAADYSPHEVSLEIILAPRSPASVGSDPRVDAASAMSWPHGSLLTRNASSGGRFDIVLDAWVPTHGVNDRVVLLDAANTALGPPGTGWFRALVRHASIRGVADAAGFALAPVPLRREGLSGILSGYADVEAPAGKGGVDADAFAYQALVPAASGVFMPANADVWRAFRAWFAARRGEWFLWPVVVGAKDKKDPMWEDFKGTSRAHWALWFTRFSVEYGLYSVYPRQSLFQADLSSVAAGVAGSELADRAGQHLPRYDFAGRPVVRKLPISEDSLARIVELAWRGDRDGIVSMTVVNKAFISTALSWICNVDAAGIRPPGVVWITTDEAARDAMQRVPNSETIFLSELEGGREGAGTSYGTPGYWLLMMERTRLIREILELGVGVFAFETDQIWLRDPVPYVKRLVRGGDDVDIVGTLDTRHEVGGNFLFLNPTLPTRRLWREVSTRFEESFRKSRMDGRSDNAAKTVKWRYIENDQSLLTRLALYDEALRARGNAVVFRALDVELFVDGRWYGEGTDREAKSHYQHGRSRSPVLINNNFIIGIENKMRRAQRHGHWFLDGDDGKCVEQKVHDAIAANEARSRVAGSTGASMVSGDIEAGLDFAIDAIGLEHASS